MVLRAPPHRLRSRGAGRRPTVGCMQITKHGHACVRIEHEGAVVVLDPGAFTEPDALDGATAVLVTHEHPDHYLVEHLRRTDAPVFTVERGGGPAARGRPRRRRAHHRGGPRRGLRPRHPRPGGGRAARGDPPRAAPHPQQRLPATGDQTRLPPRRRASPRPASPSTSCCCRSRRPGCKVSECIDFARDVGAARSLAIHDKVYSETGLGIVDSHLQRFLDPLGLTTSASPTASPCASRPLVGRAVRRPGAERPSRPGGLTARGEQRRRAAGVSTCARLRRRCSTSGVAASRWSSREAPRRRASSRPGGPSGRGHWRRGCGDPTAPRLRRRSRPAAAAAPLVEQ